MINLAIVGLGRWGKRQAESAIASGRFRVVRAVVRKKETVADYAAARSIALSTDLNEALADSQIEAVSFVTPNVLHVPQALRAAGAGKHVLVEKPFALSKTEAQAAVAACAKAGVVLAVGHDNRFYPAIVEIKRLVREGTLGTIIHAEANISHDVMRRPREESGLAVISRSGTTLEASVGAELGVARRWRLDPHEAPAGSMAHLGIHRIDSFVQIFGKIDRVFAQAARDTLGTSFPDSVALLVRFRTGMTGYIGSSLATPLNSRFQVFGSEGWVEARGPRNHQDYLLSSLKTVSLRLRDGSFDTREFDPIDSVKLNFEAFADAIEGTRPYPIPVDEMIHVITVLEAAARSLESGEAVAVQ